MLNMEFQRQKDGYFDGDTHDVLLAKIAKLESAARMALDALKKGVLLPTAERSVAEFNLREALKEQP